MASDNAVRSVWTAEDEARFRELGERRERIMAEHKQVLRGALTAWLRGVVMNEAEIDGIVQACVDNAAELREDLRHFVPVGNGGSV